MIGRMRQKNDFGDERSLTFLPMLEVDRVSLVIYRHLGVLAVLSHYHHQRLFYIT